MRTAEARQGSTPRLRFRRRLAAGAALCIATTTAAVVGASVPAFATVSAVTVTPARSAAGALTNYTINFTTTAALAADTDTVTLIGTADTVFPLVAADYTIGGVSPTATPTGTAGNVTFKVHSLIPAGAVVVGVGRVTNPATGTPTLTVQTSQETTPAASSAYTITGATAITAVTATVSPAKVSPTVALYTVNATAATAPVSGFDSITVSAPAGSTAFPLVAADYTVNAGGATTTVTATPSQTATNNVTITVPTGSTGGSAPIALVVTASNVVNPPAAGAYALTVSTTADSVPGTSPTFNIGALTNVTGVTVTPSEALAGATSNYTVGFTAATALVINTDTITIVGPTGTVFPASAGAYSVNGTASTVAPTVSPGSVTFTTHVAVPIGAVSVVITGVTNPAGGSKTLTVATSEDSIAATSSAYVITTAITGTPTVVPIPNTANALARYTITFTTTSAVAAGGTITLVGPGGEVFPLVAADYTVNGTAVTVPPVGSSPIVILTTPVSLPAATSVTVVAIAVPNPFAAMWALTVQTSTDVSPVQSTPYTIVAASGSQVTAVTASPNPTTTGVSSTYSVGFHATTAVTITSGTITIAGPAGTVFPATAASYTVNGTTAVTVSGGATAVVHTPISITAGLTVTVVASGVTNPAVGVDSLTVATTTDATASASPFYSITAVVSGGGGGPATVPAAPVRLFGSDRFGTAIAASLAEFPTAGTAGAVVLARADDYPDALVGAALAAARNAPLLFANGGSLTPATQAEIQRVLPAGGTVYLLGGTAAIPASVATSLTALGFVPTRYAGADRFGTAHRRRRRVG